MRDLKVVPSAEGDQKKFSSEVMAFISTLPAKYQQRVTDLLNQCTQNNQIDFIEVFKRFDFNSPVFEAFLKPPFIDKFVLDCGKTEWSGNDPKDNRRNQAEEITHGLRQEVFRKPANFEKLFCLLDIAVEAEVDTKEFFTGSLLGSSATQEKLDSKFKEIFDLIKAKYPGLPEDKRHLRMYQDLNLVVSQYKEKNKDYVVPKATAQTPSVHQAFGGKPNSHVVVALNALPALNLKDPAVKAQIAERRKAGLEEVKKRQNQPPPKEKKKVHVDYDATVFKDSKEVFQTMNEDGAADKNADAWRHKTKHRLVTSEVDYFYNGVNAKIVVSTGCGINFMGTSPADEKKYLKGNRKTSNQLRNGDLGEMEFKDSKAEQDYKAFYIAEYRRKLFRQDAMGRKLFVLSNFGGGLYLNQLKPSEQVKAIKMLQEAFKEAMEAEKKAGRLKNIKDVAYIFPDNHDVNRASIRDKSYLSAIETFKNNYEGPPVVTISNVNAFDFINGVLSQDPTIEIGLANAGSDRTIGGEYAVDGNIDTTKSSPFEEQIACNTTLLLDQTHQRNKNLAGKITNPLTSIDLVNSNSEFECNVIPDDLKVEANVPTVSQKRSAGNHTTEDVKVFIEENLSVVHRSDHAVKIWYDPEEDHYVGQGGSDKGFKLKVGENGCCSGTVKEGDQVAMRNLIRALNDKMEHCGEPKELILAGSKKDIEFMKTLCDEFKITVLDADKKQKPAEPPKNINPEKKPHNNTSEMTRLKLPGKIMGT